MENVEILLLYGSMAAMTNPNEIRLSQAFALYS